ncbi:MAG: undecaprenyl-diphosphate phosphatase [Thermoplasmata archaeon]|nr:undecaprenyl-diphosphate phosphatase [Thermoplasmata archaeon]
MALTPADAVVLAVIQGITEWLPISSSGHLAIAYRMLSLRPSLLFTLVLHTGTLLAVVITYKKDLLDILRAVPRALRSLARGRLPPGEEGDARMAVLLVLGTIPGALVGLLLKGNAEESYSQPFFLGIFFIATGVFLLFSMPGVFRRMANRTVDAPSSLGIGIAQAAAVFPGISRSGWTITTGILSGIRPEEAARFSLLLSVPMMAGAMLYEAATTPLSSVPPLSLIIGFLISFAVGYASIQLLLKTVRRGGLHLFAPYCMALGLLVWLFL